MTRLAREKTEVALLYVRLSATMRSSIAEGDADLKRLASGLDKMSPLKVLARGYAIATREDGRAVRDPGDVAVGDTLALRVRSARIVSRVTSIERTAPVRDETEDEP
jgi:exodeoxyribonuclease VII large subunit